MNEVEYNNNGTCNLIFNNSRKITIDIDTLEDIKLDELSIVLTNKGGGNYIPYVTDGDFSKKLNRYIVDAIGKDKVYFISEKNNYTRANLRKEIFGPRIQVLHNTSTNECCLYNRESQSYILLTSELNFESLTELDSFIKLILSNDCIIKYREATKELYCILDAGKLTVILRKLNVVLNEIDIKNLMNELH